MFQILNMETRGNALIITCSERKGVVLKFNRGNMAYVIIMLFINIKLFIDRHLSNGGGEEVGALV